MTDISSAGPTEKSLENLSEASAKASQPRKRGRPRKIAGKVRVLLPKQPEQQHADDENIALVSSFQKVSLLQHVCVLLTCIFVLL
jgi:hypothetical protein